MDIQGKTNRAVLAFSLPAVAFLFCGAVFASAALAAQPKSISLDVQVLSVDKDYIHRQAAVGGLPAFENAGFVAKVLVRSVVRSNGGDVAPGETIKVHYEIITATSPMFNFHNKPLTPGVNATIEVWGRGKDGEFRRR